MQDVQHRIYFKNLLLSYISSEIPECAKNHGLDKIKIEYPYSIIKLKGNEKIIIFLFKFFI